MPLNPVENIPASLARNYACSNYHVQNPSEEKMHERVKENMQEGYLKLSCETGHLLSSPNYNISNSLKQEKFLLTIANVIPPYLQIPSELVSRCMATLLMIQKCTERQFPPSEVAQVLDSAVASLHPCCSQNLRIYTEIQKCMGIIRNQILALVPC